jgi:hypothetical protein
VARLIVTCCVPAPPQAAEAVQRAGVLGRGLYAAPSAIPGAGDGLVRRTDKAFGGPIRLCRGVCGL